ncbi:MAG TPA: hypothetical protein VK631_04825 [Solirubrobacteraceae bacterium]|nr:hypothetical protein [Solirubrobacteraceae bacterium]
MRRLGAAAVVVGAMLGAPGGAHAADPPPGAAMSSNLEYVTRVPDTGDVVEGKFDRVRGKDVLVLTGQFGFKTLDVSDPEDPKPLDSFLPTELAEGGYWQNEDMELDTRRKLIIGALDPRHTEDDTSVCPKDGGVQLAGCKSGFYLISYADPANLRQVGDFVELPSGHTSSCIQDCKYIWTGGPARRNSPPKPLLPVMHPDLKWLGPILGPDEPDPNYVFERSVGNGRPIWVTDLTNPARPEVSDQPVDLWRNDGYTDYSHDVDEDEQGIAWVSGRGGIRGYATSGWHRDPYQNRSRNATPFDPILVAGGGVAGTSQPVMLMHNSGRPPDGAVRASGVKKDNVLVGTEEEFQTCSESGRIITSDLTDSWGGEPAQRSTLTKPYRMTMLDSFHPILDTTETAPPNLGCSAHYFEIEGSTLGAGWYGLGLRLLDISNARDIRQVGYYRVTATATEPGSNSWDMAFRTDRRKGDLIYLFDMNRGVEVLRLKKGAYQSRTMKSVVAPSLKSARYAAKLAGGLERTVNSDGSVSYVCPLFL